MSISRRSLLTLAAPSLFSQPQEWNRFPRMVHEWFVSRVRDAEQAGLAVKAKLATRADAEQYVAAVRRKVRACFGTFPERTPLQARTTGIVDRDVYRIEKILFESRPGFIVSANLYVPKANRPVPGVIGSCGHTDNGKAGETYQSFAQGLARQGYAVLIFDPIGQGERLQYLEGKVRPGTGEHLMAGNQQVLIGEVFAGWRAWDGIRALDYLLTRPEVDQRYIGITGNSGGGTMTTWLCALDSRWTMAAPSCFVTTFRRNLENELPADSEQYPWNSIGQSLDMDDFIACMAPKPVILLGKERDYFDARGLEESYARLKRLYTLLGAPDNIAMFAGEGTHGFTQDNREAMYRWFHKCTGSALSGKEPALTIEKDEVLWAAPNGRVAGLNSRSVPSMTRDTAQSLARTRKPPARLADAIRDLLRIPAVSGVADARILRPFTERGYPTAAAANYAVETEPGIHSIVYWLTAAPHLSRPPRMNRLTLYVSHQSADRELREDAFCRGLASEASGLFTVDLRGIGESRPGTAGVDSFRSPYGADYMYAGHSLMLNRPYVGQRVFDLMRVLEWLAFATGARQVHLAANGWGTIPAAFAAVLSPLVQQVTLHGVPDSYTSIAEAETYAWPLSSFVPGILQHFDLPDVYAALGNKVRRV